MKKFPALLSLFFAHRMFGWNSFEIHDGEFVDVKAGNAYPICASVFCEHCNAYFLDIRPDDESARRYYANYQSEEFFRQRESLEPSFRSRRPKLLSDDFAGRVTYLEQIEKYIQKFSKRLPKYIVDFGGGDGSATPLAATAEKVSYIDINSSHGKPSDNRCASLTDLREDKIDLIVARHVLEHLSNPVRVIQELYTIARPQTLVYLEVTYEPFARNLEKFYREKKIWTEHINFFTELSLRMLVEKNSLFSVLDVDVLSTGLPMVGKAEENKIIRLIGVK